MGSSSKPSGSSCADNGSALLTVSPDAEWLFSKMSSSSLPLTCVISLVMSSLESPERTSRDRVLVLLRRVVDGFGSIREKDLVLWRVCGRSKPCAAVGDGESMTVDVADCL